MKRKIPLKPEWYLQFQAEAKARLEDRTGTSAPQGQLRALTKLRDKTETEFRDRLRARAADHFSEFVEYMDLTEPPAAHHEFMCEKLEAIERRDILRATFSMPPGHAKHLALDTPVLTPGGYIALGDLRVGDHVFGTRGEPARVVAKSAIVRRPCYRAITSDGAEIVVSDEHQWAVYRDRNARAPETFSTAELVARSAASKDPRAFRLPAYQPLVFPVADLPLDPYVLGAWLGDGSSASGTFTAGAQDTAFFREQFAAAGYTCTPPTEGRIYFQVYTLCKGLRAAGVLNDKHIPDAYLYASIEQRLALVRGLMDTDGNARSNGGCRFVNCDERLVDQFRQLLWSLGTPNSKVAAPIKTSYWKDGYTRSPCWVVSFSDLDCFRLPRKRARLGALKHRYGRYIRFEKCPDVPTQCIAVDSADHLFLAGRGLIVTHNTKFCSRYFPAWYLGRNPEHRYLQGGHAQDFVETEYGQYVRDLIASPEYTEVFPEVTLDPASRAAGRWRIAGKRASSYVAKGVGQGISGFRGHIGGIDDMFGKREDARSPTIRDKVRKFLFSDFRPRLLPGSPWFLVGTRWHMDDGIGRVIALNKNKKGIPWHVYVLDAIIETEKEMEEDPLGRSIGEVLWPEFYTLEELMEIKATLISESGVSDWWALYKNRPREEEGNVVKSRWFRRYKDLPQDVHGTHGVAERNVRRLTISVDCAMKATARSKFTAVGVWIETTDGKHYKAHVERKRVEYVEMCELINDTAADWIRRYPNTPASILVEDASNGTAYISQWAGKAPAPVITIPKPSAEDKTFRFDAVTPMFEGGEVYLPEQALWLEQYEEEVLAFPNGSFSDQVDETSQYLAWARRRQPRKKRRVVGTRHVG